MCALMFISMYQTLSFTIQTRVDNPCTQNEQNGSGNPQTAILTKRALNQHLSEVRICLLKHKDLIIKQKNQYFRFLSDKKAMTSGY